MKRLELFNPNDIRGCVLTVQMQLLDQCNLRCKHCYVGQKKFKPRHMPSTEEVKVRINLINAFAKEIGFKRVNIHFCGGEPLVRQDIVEFVQYCTNNKIKPFIASNGTLFTKTFARRLKNAGLPGIQFSIEGPEKINDFIRGTGTYKKIRKAAKIAIEELLSVTFSITLSNNNIGSIKTLIRRLDHPNVYFHVRELLPIGDGVNMSMLSSEQRREFFEFARDYEGDSVIGPEDPIYCSILDADCGIGGCGALRDHFCIDVDGVVFPCGLLQKKVGHVDDLAKMYCSKTAIRFRKRDFKGRCNGCKLLENCGGCRAYAYYNTGDMFAEDDRCFIEK